jgi:type VI protein secretion system component VasF
MSEGPRRRRSRLFWSDLFALGCILAVLAFFFYQSWFN